MCSTTTPIPIPCGLLIKFVLQGSTICLLWIVKLYTKCQRRIKCNLHIMVCKNDEFNACLWTAEYRFECCRRVDIGLTFNVSRPLITRELLDILPYSAGGVSGTYVKWADLAIFRDVSLEAPFKIPQRRKPLRIVFAGAAMFTFTFSTVPHKKKKKKVIKKKMLLQIPIYFCLLFLG
jgi:hypothetical protein